MEEMSYIISWGDGPTITSTPCFYRWPGIQFSGGSQQFATPVPEDSMPSSNLHSTRHTNDTDTGIQVKHSNTQNKINKVKCLNFNFIIKSINENLYNNKSTGWNQEKNSLIQISSWSPQDGWTSKGTLSPNLTNGDQSHGHKRWKDRTNSHKLFFNFHEHVKSKCNYFLKVTNFIL